MKINLCLLDRRCGIWSSVFMIWDDTCLFTFYYQIYKLKQDFESDYLYVYIYKRSSIKRHFAHFCNCANFYRFAIFACLILKNVHRIVLHRYAFFMFGNRVGNAARSVRIFQFNIVFLWRVGITKETPSRRITVTSSLDEISTDQLENMAVVRGWGRWGVTPPNPPSPL